MRDREGENMEKSNLGRKKSEVNLFSYSFIIWRSLFQGKVKKKTFEKQMLLLAGSLRLKTAGSMNVKDPLKRLDVSIPAQTQLLTVENIIKNIDQ